MKRSNRSRTWVIMAFGAALLQACATTGPVFETPSVTVTSFRPLPSQGLLPRFEIGLRVVNPNRVPLALVGMAYSVSLEGQEIIEGVSNELPTIEAYGEGEVTFTAVPNLMGGMRLITDLMSRPRAGVDYVLEAKLDIGALAPPIRVRDEGRISLAPG